MADADDTLKTSGTPQPNSGEQPTLLTPPNSGSKPPATLADSSGAPLQYTSATQLSIPIQDLSGDALLASAPRMQFDNRSVPSLGGIPLLAKLGQGGMGAVYFGVKVLLRQEVAVKVLPLHLAQAQPDLIARFVREAQIAAGITSRHLVHVTDVSESAGLFFLVMEFVKGQSAGSCLKKVQAAPGGAIGLDEASALDICIAASQGLADAHAHGVIHRDVKPDNILIPQDTKTGALIFSEAKIADLGLARGEDMAGASLTGAQSAMGTPGFMAPEQALNARKAGKPADVFAMGVTLYALIGGSSPFKGETITETILATIQKSHEPLTTRCPNVSAATGALIERCLAKDPLQRYVDASALVEALRVCRAALGTSDSRQAAAMETLLKLQVAPEVGQAVPSSSVVGNLGSSSPPAPGSFGTGTSAAGSSTPSQSGGAAKLIAAVVALVVLGIAGALYFSRSPQTSPAAIKPAAAPVEIGIACGHEKVEWVKWAIAQYAQLPAGANVQVDCIPLSPQDSQAAILLKDPRIQIFAPASSFYREAFVTEFKAKFNSEPIAREENVALTPLVYLTFEDRYQEFIKKYKEVNLETLNQAMRTSGWGEIANRPDWGRFTFVCSNPLEYNNGLTALALMACYHVNKDRGLTVEDVNAPSFQEWGRVFAPAFDVRGTPAQLIKDMVLKGPSTHEFILTYESAVVVNLANAEGRWGGMRVIYPKMNVWNDHPFYLISAPWIADPQKKAASNFIDFLLSEPIQHELPKYGFRPGNPKVPILFPESPFEKYKAMGLKVDVPITIEVPHETVLEALYASAKKWIHRGGKQ